MRLYYIISVALCAVSVSLAMPVGVELEERDTEAPTSVASNAGTPTLPPGSILGTPGDASTASPPPAVQSQNLDYNFQWQIWKKCSADNKNTIFQAWKDSKRLSDALRSWKPNEAYQPAMDMYMGKRTTYEDVNYNFPLHIESEYDIYMPLNLLPVIVV
jgi:hypothetical protein